MSQSRVSPKNLSRAQPCLHIYRAPKRLEPGLEPEADWESDALPTEHGSSEGHEMLKRNDKYRSIADDVPIPKMYFLSKSVDGLFKKIALLCQTRYFFVSDLAKSSVHSQAGKSH